jgi:16S rRNA (cytosine967-C5)-methyltransferase
MDDEAPRAIVLGMLKRERGLDAEAVARLVDGGRYAPPPLTEVEQARLASADLDRAIRILRGCSGRNGQKRAPPSRHARRSICG